MNNPFSLENKQILVTGASSGIGRSIAIECSKMGATVIITGRSKERLVDTLSKMVGIGHKLIIADLTKDEDIERLVLGLEKLDGIVQNAGVAPNSETCKFITVKNFHATVSVNLLAPIMLQKALLEKKLLNEEASVVFVASRAAFSPIPGNGVYSASKGALISYSKVLAIELAPRKIRVNCICPAMVWTDMISNATFSKETAEIGQNFYPLKRYGNPDDIAFLAIYLLSNTSKWMTGSSIDITGGGMGILT
jgi:NAD(P)-dependent dehydrogenase (short-subunit alcohol dehydrogenase family)